MTVLPDAGRRAVLLRAPTSRRDAVPAAARRASSEAWRDRARRGARAAAPHVAAQLAERARRRPAPAADRAPTCWTSAVGLAGRRVRPRARRLRRRAEVPAVDGAGVPAAPPRPHRGRRCAADGRRAPARRWPAAACTTSSPAASPATPSTRPGSCRTSRRCCTTTPCCCASTSTCGGPPASPLAERVARETADFLLRDLRTPEGGFASALDADTDGVEGLTYAWTPAQLARGARRRGRRPRPPRCSRSPPHGHLRARCVDAAAARRARRRALVRTRSAPRLLAARAERPQPARDDKVVTSWNGLAIAALAEAGAPARPSRDYLDARPRSAPASSSRAHLVDGRLRRASRDGVVGAAHGGGRRPRRPGRGAAGAAPGDRRARAGWATRPGCSRWRSSTSPTTTAGSTTPPDDAEQLFTRPRNPADNAEPAGHVRDRGSTRRPTPR